MYQQDSKVPLVVDAVYSVAHALNNFFKENCEQPLMWYQNNQTCVGWTNETRLNVVKISQQCQLYKSYWKSSYV